MSSDTTIIVQHSSQANMNSQSIGEVNSKVFEIEWRMDMKSDFSSKANSQKVSSPVFYTRSFGKEIKWHLDLYPNGDRKDAEGHASIFLSCLNVFGVEATVNFFFLNKNNIKVKESARVKSTYEPLSRSWGYAKFADMSFITDPANNLLRKDGKITIGCKIMVHNVCTKDHRSSEESVVLDDFEKLLLNEKFSDLTVVSRDERKLFVHKCILTSRSPVFEAMFEHDMLEKIQSQIKMEDVKYEVLLELFRFLYCGKVNNVTSILFELLYAAEKYSIEGLKLLCEEVMLLKLSLDNATEYLVAAEKNNCQSVKIITEYIVRNAKDIVKTPEFELAVVSHPKVMYKIMNAIVYKNNSV